MGTTAGKQQPAGATSTSRPRAEGSRPMAVQEMDMFETESFRPGSGRYRRHAPAFRPPEEAARTVPTSRADWAAPESRVDPVSRAVPATRPPRQEYQAEPIVRQQTVDRPIERDPVRADVNPWLDDNIWPEGGLVAPLTPVENTDRDRHPPLTAFPPQPPPYQAVEDPVRPKPIGKQGSKPPPAARPPQAARPPPEAAPTPAPPINTKQQPPTDPSAQPLDSIQEETPRVDHDKPDFSNYVVPSLLSPEHVMHMSDEPRVQVAPPTVQSVHEKDDDVYIGANLKFYRNQIRFRPNGEFIDYIHRYWFKHYRVLEKCHTYIQWLFPISESSSVNRDAVPLRAHEARHIYADLETRSRYINSYKLMLDFYGFRVTNLQTGKIERKENWSERFYNLLRNPHNNARITRILKSLGELGLAQYQSPFVMALLHEVFDTRYLHGVSRNTIMYWIRAINNQFERDYVYKLFYDHIMRLDTKKQYPPSENKRLIVDKRQPIQPLVM